MTWDELDIDPEKTNLRLPPRYRDFCDLDYSCVANEGQKGTPRGFDI